MYVFSYACMYVCMHVRMYVRMYVCVGCMYVNMWWISEHSLYMIETTKSVAGSAFYRFVQAKGLAQVQELLASQEPLLTHDEWCVCVCVCVYGRERKREKEREKKLARRFSLTIIGT